MGGQVSAQWCASDSGLLKRFAGLQPITDNDPFWNQLIAFNWRLDETDKRASARFEESAMDVYESLMYNTATTGNVAALVRVFLRRAAELKASVQCHDKIFLWQTSNALLILRHCAKFLTERLTEAEFIRVFSKNILSNEGELTVKNECDENFENSAEEFLNALIEIIVDLPYTGDASSLHMEAVKCLIVMLSRQLHRERAFTNSRMLHYMMVGKCSIHAPLLAKVLLHNFVLHGDAPPSADRRTDADEQRGSVVLGVAASVWSALEWGAAVVAGDEPSERADDDTEACDDAFGVYCLLLAVCLSCYAPQKVANGHDNKSAVKRNPYREALASFQNSQETSSVSGASGTHSVATFKLDYGALYSRLCACVRREPAMLLLYMLLHSNQPFRTYVLSRVSLDELIVPVLRVLHDGQKAPSEVELNAQPRGHNHHVYLSLVVLLMLSEDDFYCKVVHETTLENVGWAVERPIAQITLGGLLILVLVRTVQINIVKMRDRYLHTNALATLSNMAPYWRRVPAQACQRLVALLELLARRHARQLVLMHAAIETGADERNARAIQDDVSAFEEAIRTLLEILNRCATHELRHNAPLIYAMLHKRAVFDQLAEHPLLHDLVTNLLTVLNHFGNRVSALEKGSSANAIMDVIEKGALQWPSDRLKKFPDMTFRYVEDDNTEDFFVPYVWKLIYSRTALYWQPKRIKLFRTADPQPQLAAAAAEQPSSADKVLMDADRSGVRQHSIGEEEVTRILQEEMNNLTAKDTHAFGKEEII